jgi:GT2 family glycosyltransferase
MMLSKQALEKVSGFDEQFFMYGEDIDLSYRILQAGFKNYYKT